MPYITYNGKNIHYQVDGLGKPIVMLNGIMMSVKSWEPFREEFSKNHQLIRLDFIDQGQSDSSDIAYDLTYQADIIYELIKHLKLEKIVLVGISYGGEVALKFSLKYQNYIDRLIVFNSVSYTTKTLAQTGHSWNKFASEKDALSYYEATIPVIYSKAYHEIKQEWMAKRKETLIQGPFSDENFLKRMISLTNSSESYDIRPNLNEILVPTLIVGSEEDSLTPLVHQRLLHKNIKNSRLVILPGVGHASMYEVPELFSMIVLGYTNSKLTYTI